MDDLPDPTPTDTPPPEPPEVRSFTRRVGGRYVTRKRQESTE